MRSSFFCSSERVGFGALLEVEGLLVESAHAVDRLVDAVDEALALVVGEAQLANDARDANLLAAQQPARLAVQARVLLGQDAGELLQQLLGLLVMLVELVDLAGDVFQAIEQHLFGDLVLVEEHHFLDGTDAALEVFAHGDDLADDDRRTRQRLEHAQLAALDALGDFHFAFAGEQRNGAHLAQVHANGVVGLLESARGEVELDVFTGFDVALIELVERAGRLGSFQNIDALAADGGHEIIEVVGRVHIVRDQVVHLIVGEVALFFSHVDQFFNVVKLVFKSQSGFSSAPVAADALVQCTLRREWYRQYHAYAETYRF